MDLVSKTVYSYLLLMISTISGISNEMLLMAEIRQYT